MHSRSLWYTQALVILIALAVLAGCSSPTPVIAPTQPPATTVAPATATLLPQPTETATSLPPTATPLPPTATLVPPTPTATETPLPSATPTMTPTVALPTAALVTAPPSGWGGGGDNLSTYYIQLKTGGSVGCGDSAIGVGIGLKKSGDMEGDIKEALTRLFAFKGEYFGSLYNPVFRSNLAVESVKFNSDNGLITVNLRGTYVPSGDDCDNTRVKAQVWNTIRQFRDIKMTNIYLNGGPFGDKVSNDK